MESMVHIQTLETLRFINASASPVISSAHAWPVKAILENQTSTHEAMWLTHQPNPNNIQTPELQLQSSSPARRMVAPPCNFPKIPQTYTVLLVFQ